jgi:hypothetical protein
MIYRISKGGGADTRYQLRNTHLTNLSYVLTLSKKANLWKVCRTAVRREGGRMHSSVLRNSHLTN